MTVQEIHRHIWDTIIRSHVKNREEMIEAKRKAVDELFAAGAISQSAYNTLGAYHNCVLCRIYLECEDCPLNHCSEGLYVEATLGDKKSCEKIRDLELNLDSASEVAIRILEDVDS